MAGRAKLDEGALRLQTSFVDSTPDSLGPPRHYAISMVRHLYIAVFYKLIFLLGTMLIQQVRRISRIVEVKSLCEYIGHIGCHIDGNESCLIPQPSRLQ